MAEALVEINRLFCPTMNFSPYAKYVSGKADSLKTDGIYAKGFESSRTAFKKAGIEVTVAGSRPRHLVVVDPAQMAAFYERAAEMNVGEKCRQMGERVKTYDQGVMLRYYSILGARTFTAPMLREWAAAIRARITQSAQNHG